MANTADYTAANGDLVFAVRELSPVTVSTLLSSCVLLGLMAIQTHQKPDEILGIGDPDVSSVISGAKLDPAKIREIEQCGQYSPLVESVRQSDFQRQTWRGNMPTASQQSGTAPVFTVTVVNGSITAVAVSTVGTGYSGAAPTLEVVDATGSCGYGASLVPTISSGSLTAVTVRNGGQGYAASGVSILQNVGNSEGQRYARPVFKWSEMKQVGEIYNRDIDSARKMTQLYDTEVESGPEMTIVQDAMRRELANQAEEICNDLWYGNPSDQTQTIYDQPFGLLSAIDDGTNYTNYAGVDRTLTANYWWRAKVDTTARSFGFKDAVEDAHMKKGLLFKGGGLDVFLVNPSLHSKWKAENIAYTQNVNIKDELQEMAKYGVKMDVIQYGNTYAVADFRCPTGTAIGLNTKSMIIAFKKGRKFTPTELFDQRGIPGGIDGSRFFIETQIMPMCVAPALNVKYTNIN